MNYSNSSTDKEIVDSNHDQRSLFSPPRVNTLASPKGPPKELREKSFELKLPELRTFFFRLVFPLVLTSPLRVALVKFSPWKTMLTKESMPSRRLI
mmetsp:Transcript_7384/g.8582  ORF Transcript_7384/g.8582 Transcript_7384/m.8582 type:complete len:96 (-) Transcript_7384:505-792(-)